MTTAAPSTMGRYRNLDMRRNAECLGTALAQCAVLQGTAAAETWAAGEPARSSQPRDSVTLTTYRRPESAAGGVTFRTGAVRSGGSSWVRDDAEPNGGCHGR